MGKSILLLIYLLFIHHFTVAQDATTSDKPKKNEPKKEYKTIIGFFYGPALTKTDFPEKSSLFLNDFYETAKPSLPLWGKVIGLEILRSISKKNSISLFIRHTTKGQKSPHYYNFYGKTDTSDYSPGYGGGSYEIKLITNEIGLRYGRQVFNNKFLTTTLLPGLSLDFFNKMTVQDYIIEKNTGLKRPGCCTAFFYGEGESYFNRSYNNLKKMNARIGLLLAVRFDFKMSERLFFAVKPEIEYLTSSLISKTKKNRTYIPHGSIFLLNAQFEIGFKI